MGKKGIVTYLVEPDYIFDSILKVVATLRDVVCPGSGRGLSRKWVWYKRFMWALCDIMSLDIINKFNIVIKQFDKMKF